MCPQRTQITHPTERTKGTEEDKVASSGFSKVVYQQIFLGKEEKVIRKIIHDD